MLLKTIGLTEAFSSKTMMPYSTEIYKCETKMTDKLRFFQVQQRCKNKNSPGQTRTADLVINSHPLYQLSYRGSSSVELIYLY